MLNMSKTRIALGSLFLLIVCSPANSDSEFEQWRQQQQQSFQEYRDERDREFTAFLKEHWREMELMKGVVRDEKPKPVVMPVAKPQPPKPEPSADEIPVLIVKPEPVVITPKPTEPVQPVPIPGKEYKGLRAHVDYFGTRITFFYDPAFKKSLPYRLNEAALSKFWSELSKVDYEPLLEQLDVQSQALRLNDWGYAVLTNKLSEQIYPTSKNRQALFSWFVLTKAGFRSRVAYDERNVYLLIPSKHQLYDVTYFTFDNERYYAISFDGGSSKPGKVYTYDGHYPGAVKKLDLTIRTKAPKGENAEERSLSFDYGGKQYDFIAEYEKERIEFLDTYPQLDLELYFDSEVGEAAESPLLQQLAKELEGMSEQQAVNFLLRFVQTSFKYRTDDKQFGKENYLFPEETIFYPYSDCEDRSIFFAWLVKRLLKLDVVGLNYPGHVATAVNFTQDADGDFVAYNGSRYTVADPTYINATAGMTMPEYSNTKPGVISFR